MPPIPNAAFARALRGLATPELAAFVADLWAARGRETRVEGNTVVVTHRGTTRRLLAAPRGRLGRRLPGWLAGQWDPATASATHDAVVVRAPAADDREGDRIIDADELREMALYAVDPTTRDRLFERHLGRSATVEPTPDRHRRRSLALVGAALFLVVAAAVGVVAHDRPGDDGPSSAATDAEPTERRAAPTTTGSSPGTEVDPLEAARNASGGPFPLGAGPGGIESATQLARSHTLGLAGRSYRWRLTYQEVVDGRTRGAVNETIAVENATVYRSDVDRSGTVRFAPSIVPTASSYANGSDRFVRAEDGGHYHRYSLGTGPDDRSPIDDDPFLVIDWYLSVRESWLLESTARAGVRYHRYAGRGDDWPGAADARVAATVDQYGVVRRLNRTHRIPDTDTRIVVTFRVDGIGNTVVRPPPWLDDARRATANATAG